MSSAHQARLLLRGTLSILFASHDCHAKLSVLLKEGQRPRAWALGTGPKWELGN